MCFLNAVLILAMWFPSTSPAPIIAFAALYGFSSGAFISNSPPCVAQISPDMSKIGVRNGTFFAFIAIAGLISNPIGGSLISSWGGSYTGLQIFAGVMCFWGSCMIVMARVRVAGWKWSTKF